MVLSICGKMKIREIEIATNSEGQEVSRVDLGVVDYELRASDWGLRRFIPSLRQMWESNTTLAETAPRALEAAGVNIPPRLVGAATSIFSRLALASVSLASFTPGSVEWVPLDGREDLPIWV